MVEALELTPYLDRIVCEVTERQALTHLGRSALEGARRSGMSVAIDDFGTGHSGLMQIVGLDFDILKIDHSLIDTILTNQTAARMLRGIVASPPRCVYTQWRKESRAGKRRFSCAPPGLIAAKDGFGVRPSLGRWHHGYWIRDTRGDCG